MKDLVISGFDQWMCFLAFLLFVAAFFEVKVRTFAPPWQWGAFAFFAAMLTW